MHSTGVQLLPILKMKPASQTGVIIETRKADKPDESQDDGGMHACAQDIMSAVKSGDVKALASALQAMIDIAEPSADSDDSVEPHSYDAQNIAAGQE